MTTAIRRSHNAAQSAIAYLVRQDVARKTGIPANSLRITNYSSEEFGNGCLNLPKPNEMCTEAIVRGWRITLSNGRQNWTYRTDNSGRNLRLENPDTPISNVPEVPESVKNAVLQAASQRTRLRTSLRIVKFDQIVTDGCLNLPRPNEACIEIAQNAWRVTVAAGIQRLVYHANQTGSIVRLNAAASSLK